MTTQVQLPTDGPRADGTKEWSPLEFLLLPLFRSRFVVIGFGALGLFGGVFFALLQPNEFRSTAKIRFQAGTRESLPADVLPGQGPLRSTTAALNNEYYLLNSHETFDQVARRVGPDKILSPYDPAANDPEGSNGLRVQFHRLQSWWFRPRRPIPASPEDKHYEEAVRVAAEKLEYYKEFKIPRATDIIEIGYRAHDPVLAKLITTAFVDVHTRRHGELYSLSSRFELLEGKLGSASGKVSSLEHQLGELRQAHHIFDFEQQSADLVSDGERLVREVSLDRGSHQLQRQYLAELEVRIADVPVERSVGGTYEWIENPGYAAARRRVETAQINLQDQEAQYRPDHPRFNEILAPSRRELTRAQEELGTVNPLIKREAPTTTELNPRHEQLTDRIVEVRAKIAELELMIETKTRLATDLRSRFKSMTAKNSDLRLVSRQLDSARQEETKYRRAIEALDFARERDSQNDSNLVLLSAANTPYKKSGPDRAKMVIAGIFAGFFLGTVIAVLRNLLNRTVRRRNDLRDLIGVPVLSVVPVQGGWKKAQAQIRKYQPPPQPSRKKPPRKPGPSKQETGTRKTPEYQNEGGA